MHFQSKKIKIIITASYFFIFLIILPYKNLIATEIRVGVASNFLMPINAIKQTFESENNIVIHLSSGSSGSLYSQIINGAPLDIFLSANQDLPKKLENTTKGIKGTRFTYATGKLLLFSTNTDFFDFTFPNIILSQKIKYIGLGNPKYVPYGMAAKEVLRSLKIYNVLEKKLVLSKNVNQVFLMNYFGNLDVGFIAKSDFIIKNKKGKVWDIPQNLYSPIKQDAILLKNGEKKSEARTFLKFLSSEKVKDKLISLGYIVN
jgi:molybdate transport system substrate-binding protein